jgi:hypothetical protein
MASLSHQSQPNPPRRRGVRAATLPPLLLPTNLPTTRSQYANPPTLLAGAISAHLTRRYEIAAGDPLIQAALFSVRAINNRRPQEIVPEPLTRGVEITAAGVMRALTLEAFVQPTSLRLCSE